MTTDKPPATLATAKPGGCVQLKDFPSPGGQGDARAKFSEWWSQQSCAIGTLLPYEIARLGWAGALAARQPVADKHPDDLAVDLAADHCGMRVDYHGLLRQVQDGLRHNPALAEMVRQLHGHLTELGKRWYAGDRKVVDELLQLYGIEDRARRTLIDSKAVANG